MLEFGYPDGKPFLGGTRRPIPREKSCHLTLFSHMSTKCNTCVLGSYRGAIDDLSITELRGGRAQTFTEGTPNFQQGFIDGKCFR